MHLWVSVQHCTKHCTVHPGFADVSTTALCIPSTIISVPLSAFAMDNSLPPNTHAFSIGPLITAPPPPLSLSCNPAVSSSQLAPLSHYDNNNRQPQNFLDLEHDGDANEIQNDEPEDYEYTHPGDLTIMPNSLPLPLALSGTVPAPLPQHNPGELEVQHRLSEVMYEVCTN